MLRLTKTFISLISLRILKTLSRLDMRALNSGRRWGSDVPTFKDIAHAVGVLYERFQNRSAELRTIVDRVEGVKDKFSKVLLNTAETKPCVTVARELKAPYYSLHRTSGGKHI
jgi:hypothetical protein